MTDFNPGSDPRAMAEYLTQRDGGPREPLTDADVDRMSEEEAEAMFGPDDDNGPPTVAILPNGTWLRPGDPGFEEALAREPEESWTTVDAWNATHPLSPYAPIDPLFLPLDSDVKADIQVTMWDEITGELFRDSLEIYRERLQGFDADSNDPEHDDSAKRFAQRISDEWTWQKEEGNPPLDPSDAEAMMETEERELAGMQWVVDSAYWTYTGNGVIAKLRDDRSHTAILVAEYEITPGWTR